MRAATKGKNDQFHGLGAGNRLGPDMLPAGDMLSCQRRLSGFAFLMLTTRDGGDNSIGCGGRRW
jgi:hypothetical protein